MVLLTVLGKLCKELHAAIQNSPELSAQFPALAKAYSKHIAAATSVAAISASISENEPGVSTLGPAPDPALQLEAQQASEALNGQSNPIKPLINKALQMTGVTARCLSCNDSQHHAMPTTDACRVLITLLTLWCRFSEP